MSAIIMIGPFSDRYKELGAETYSDLHAARYRLSEASPEVLAVSLTALKESKFKTLWQEIKKKNKHTQIILITPPDYRTTDIVKIHQEFQLFRWRTSFDSAELMNDLSSAFEYSKTLQQSEELDSLFQEQNTKLQRLQNELQLRIEKRTKYLTESRRKLFLMNSRVEVFHQLLLKLETLKSTEQIEQTLNETLSSPLDIVWVKLLQSSDEAQFESEIDKNFNYTLLKIPLFHFDQPLGSLFFMKAKPSEFNKEESDFLFQISEAVSLIVERINKENELILVKRQWDSTFAAVKDPILLINSEYLIVQSNLQQLGYCFEKLYQRNSPCENCQRGENFTLQKNKKTYQVHSQKISIDNQEMFLNLYQDKSDELRLEAQVLESARSAEIGTISSSMAHELNNPLGGLLTFLQMIKMDLSQEPKSDVKLIEDIQEMETGALRCKDIIQNLLIYSREQNPLSKSEILASEWIQSIRRILEMQVKSMGATLQIEMNNDFLIQGSLNLISQALRNLVQVLLENSSTSNRQKGMNKQLVLRFSAEDLTLDFAAGLTLSVNFDVDFKLIKNSHFSWTLAEQILSDQNVKIEILTSPQPGSLLKLAFPRPVLRS